MTFHGKSSSKCLIKEIILATLIYISVCLWATDLLNLKFWIFSGHTASFKIEISKVQDFGILNFHPWICTMNHLKFVVSNQKDVPIRTQ